MRTTVNIPDHLMMEAKKLAVARRVPLAAVFEESLRLYLSECRARRTRSPRSRLPVTDAGRPVSGVDLDDVSELLELR